MIMPVALTHLPKPFVMGAEVFHNLKSVLKKLGYSTNVGDGRRIRTQPQIERGSHNCNSSGYRKCRIPPWRDIYIALDPASSEYYLTDEKVYHCISQPVKTYPCPNGYYWKGWVTSTQSFPLKMEWPKTTGG
jgi:enolase